MILSPKKAKDVKVEPLENIEGTSNKIKTHCMHVGLDKGRNSNSYEMAKGFKFKLQMRVEGGGNQPHFTLAHLGAKLNTDRNLKLPFYSKLSRDLIPLPVGIRSLRSLRGKECELYNLSISLMQDLS